MLEFFLILSLFSQELSFSQEAGNVVQTEKASIDILGFENLILGSDYDEVLSKLDSSENFIYNSEQPSWIEENPVIVAEGRGFVEKGYFQFVDKKLYTITVEINQNKIDYYTIFTELKKKYGNYKKFSPKMVLWESEKCTLFLERPLTLKYLDKNLHQKLLDSASIKKSKKEILRENFLEKF